MTNEILQKLGAYQEMADYYEHAEAKDHVEAAINKARAEVYQKVIADFNEILHREGTRLIHAANQ